MSAPSPTAAPPPDLGGGFGHTATQTDFSCQKSPLEAGFFVRRLCAMKRSSQVSSTSITNAPVRLRTRQIPQKVRSPVPRGATVKAAASIGRSDEFYLSSWAQDAPLPVEAHRHVEIQVRGRQAAGKRRERRSSLHNMQGSLIQNGRAGAAHDPVTEQPP